MASYHWMYPVYPNYYNDTQFTYYGQPMYYGIHNEFNQLNSPNYTTNPYEYPHLKDHGKSPYVTNINQVTKQNSTFRTAIWTGEYLQVTVMSIDVGDDIGLEVHHDHDQFLRIEAGEGFVQMGDNKHQLSFERRVGSGSAIMVPAGKWHNIKNIGNQPLKLYSIYAPPEHEFGTVHQTKSIALENH